MAEDRFAQLEHPMQVTRGECPKIQRVAHYLRHRQAFAQHYSPRMVSLGPIHHGEPHLQLGEKYKLMWASKYVQGQLENAKQLHGKIAVNIKELKGLYTEDAIRHIGDEELAWMLFVDGCSLLQIFKVPDILNPGPLNIKVDQMAIVRQDALLLENQIPFRVLSLLSDHTDANLFKAMDDFLLCHHFSRDKPDQSQPQVESDHVINIESDHVINTDALRCPPPPARPAHLLDELRRKVLLEFRTPQISNQPLDFNPQISNQIQNMITYRNLKELKAAGIQVKRSESKCPIDITFSSYWFSGELKLPDIVVDETVRPTYLNLMAYEACPDFENNYEISSYVEFLDSLIDHPDDVKELRKAKVLHNSLGSDEEVANLYNVISADLVPNTAIYASLRAQIENHYKKRYKTWFALAFNTYFSNPWSIIAFIVASVALLLTFIQTWFAAFPSDQSHS